MGKKQTADASTAAAEKPPKDKQPKKTIIKPVLTPAQQAAEQKRAQSAKHDASAALMQQAKQAANAKTQAKGLLKVNAGAGLITAYADTEVELRATVTGGDGRHTIKWQQTSGASVTLEGDTLAEACERPIDARDVVVMAVREQDADRPPPARRDRVEEWLRAVAAVDDTAGLVGQFVRHHEAVGLVVAERDHRENRIRAGRVGVVVVHAS